MAPQKTKLVWFIPLHFWKESLVCKEILRKSKCLGHVAERCTITQISKTPFHIWQNSALGIVFVDICESLSHVWVEFIPGECWMLLSPSVNSCRFPCSEWGESRASLQGKRCSRSENPEKAIWLLHYICGPSIRVMTNFPGENWQGDVVPLSLLAGSSVEIYVPEGSSRAPCSSWWCG